MIKAKGDRKVENWTHSRSGLTTDIYLRGTSFVATFLEREYKAPDVSILRRALNDAAEHWIELDWFGIIEVSVGDDENSRTYGRRARKNYDNADGEALEFKRERYWISQSPAGEIYYCAWDVDETLRKANMQALENLRYGRGASNLAKAVRLCGLPLSAPMKTDDGGIVLAYDPVLWEKLTHIVKSIALLRWTLYDLIKTKEGLAQLRDGNPGALLLEGGKQ